MVLIVYKLESAIIGNTDAVILADRVALPLVRDQSTLNKFVESVERSGANIYPGMPLSELKSMYALWFDAYAHNPS